MDTSFQHGADTMWNVGQKTISTWVKKTKPNNNNNNNIIKILHFQHYPHSTNWNSITCSNFSQNKRGGKVTQEEREKLKWNDVRGFNTEQRGNWAGEHTAILSNVSNKQNLQMFVCTNDLWSYRNPRRLDDAPSPTGHSEDVIHQEKTSLLSRYIRQQRKLKCHPGFLLFFFALNISQLLIYFIICSEVSFFKHFF